MKNLYVTEIFKSIQGESTYQGEVCVFVRLSTCNLSCVYCDTLYAHEKGRLLSLNEILSTVKSFGINLVEVTGGEPLFQPFSIDLLSLLVDEGFDVLLETNGSISIKDVPNGVVKIVDMKSPSSGMWDKMDLSNLSLLSPNDQVKMVLMNREDYLWAKALIKKYRLDERCKVLLSSAFEFLPPSELADWIVDDCLNVRMNLQIHKFIYGKDSRK